MTIETIAIYYTPLASTKVVAYVGLGLAYHMALVYTNAAGQSFGASSGPSNLNTLQTPAHALTALFYVRTNTPSTFGTLVSDPHNNTVFGKGLPEDYYTQDAYGQEYPHAMVMQAANLSAQWHSILNTYSTIGRLRLTYSPTSQNSNSMAGTALRDAGLRIPFSSATVFAPGAFTRLPDSQARLRRDLDP